MPLMSWATHYYKAVNRGSEAATWSKSPKAVPVQIRRLKPACVKSELLVIADRSRGEYVPGLVHTPVTP